MAIPYIYNIYIYYIYIYIQRLPLLGIEQLVGPKKAPIFDSCRLEVIAKTGTVKAEPHMEAKLKTKKSLRSARDGRNRLAVIQRMWR